MDRRGRILEHIRPGMRGIEIGPYFAPLVPKAEGWDVLTVDVFPLDVLREKAAADPNIPDAAIPRIEPVDLLGPAQRLAELAKAAGHAPGRFDFIVSSHNFEHLPDPIRFLQAAERLLRPGGVLSMAIPDKRACFDLLRPRSTLGAWLDAFRERREQPTPRQVFEFHAEFAPAATAGDAPPPGAPLPRLAIAERVEEAYDAWRRSPGAADAPYEDVHCWTFTPASADLLLRDLGLLRLTGLEVIGCGPTVGNEFVLHLRRPVAVPAIDRATHYATRRRLLAAMLAEDADARPDGPAEARLAAVLASRSWRMTAPLRAVAALLRGR